MNLASSHQNNLKLLFISFPIFFSPRSVRWLPQLIKSRAINSAAFPWQGHSLWWAVSPRLHPPVITFLVSAFPAILLCWAAAVWSLLCLIPQKTCFKTFAAGLQTVFPGKVLHVLQLKTWVDFLGFNILGAKPLVSSFIWSWRQTNGNDLSNLYVKK